MHSSRTGMVAKGLAALSFALAACGGAEAQTRYWIRERIVGMPITAPAGSGQTPTYSYTPVYSATYSACSGGTQSAPISGCTRSDGAAAAVSDCSSSPQTVSRTCAVTYTPTYAAYGACYGGTQTAPIQKCTSSDGQVVANSNCSPNSTSRACSTTSCAALAQNYYVPDAPAYDYSTASSSVAAAEWCNAHQPSSTSVGNCSWDSGSKRVSIYVGGSRTYIGNSTQWAGLCR